MIFAAAFPTELNEDVAYRVGRGLCRVPDAAKRVAVGRDIRLSSAALTDALCRGLTDSGVDVADIGVCGTEGVYFATFDGGYDGGIMVTASHNPPDYNGMKFVREQSKPISARQRPEGDPRRSRKRGAFPTPARARRAPRRRYHARLCRASAVLRRPARSCKPLKIVVNAGNGGAGLIIDQLEPHLPFEFIKVHHEPDGRFPNGIPNPMLEENRAPTIGGDRRERRGFRHRLGRRFRPLLPLRRAGRFHRGLLHRRPAWLASLLRGEPGGKVVHDPRLTWNTIEIVRGGGRRGRSCPSPAMPSSSSACARSTASMAAR